MNNIIKLPQLAWFGSRDLELLVPDSWQVEIHNMAGFNTPEMEPDQIKAAISRSIGSPTLNEIAKGKKEIVILFDDMSRITPVSQIVPFILDELAAAGISDQQIRFISALGCHGALGRSDFVKKLGEDIVKRFPVYNHNAFENCCTYIGTTSQGLRLSVNTEVMKCDLKIGIGSIEPHVFAGFGGGSKILLPGVSSLETNEAFHRLGAKLIQDASRPIGMGIYEGNPVRQMIEEAGIMAGLNFKIDCLFNMRGEITHAFSGSPQGAFNVGVKAAQAHYQSPRARDNDIVIANTYSKVSEPMSAIGNSTPSIDSHGGDLVLINNSPEGHVVHFLMGTFGRQTGGALWRRHQLPERINRLIVFTEYPDASFTIPLEPQEKIMVVDKWNKVLDLLNDKNRAGQKLKVAVYPNAEVQYCASD
jgi:nickel-dependent lactate racemase